MSMLYARAHIEAIGYELPFESIATRDLEARLAPVYQRLGLPDGHVELLTGVAERRYWPRGAALADGAAKAALKALRQADCTADALDAVIYAGVCRDELEPATACAVAAALGVREDALVYDVGNACLGVLNGIVDLAGRIERGELRAGLVVACESARDIVDDTIARLLAGGDREAVTTSLATLTGGSGAVAVLVTDGSLAPAASGRSHRLAAAVWRNDVRRHELCRWGFRRSEHAPAASAGQPSAGAYEQVMHTDAAQVLRYGVELGRRTWRALLDETGWRPQDLQRVIPHQVGQAHRQHILAALELSPDQDYATYPHLGNMGTVSVPLSAALAAERGRLARGDRVAWLGIGSGLNCLMLAWEW
jgi:3-oxoacyl-[acyl-carrier-protein] synthase-3